MGTSRLTDAEVTSYIMQANEYVKLSVPYNSILPVKRIKDGYTHTWYVNTEVDAPESSKDGRAGHDVRTARTSGSANIQSYVNTFEIPRIEVTMAQDSGVPIWSENIAAATRKMNDTILHLQIRGSNALIDNVSITGMYGGGTDVNAGLDANKWNTPPAPILNHLAAGFGDLNDAGYTVGGLTWLMSSVLAPGLIAKYGAGDPSMRTLMADYGVARTIFLPTGTVSRMNVYPMGAAAGDEGLWFLYTNNPAHHYLAEVMPITTKINPVLDERLQVYHGRQEWRGTVAIVQASSISHEDQVDLA